MSSESPGVTSKTVKVRTDVSERYKARKHFDEFVIKASLNKFIQGEENVKVNLRKALELRINAFSKKIIYTSRSLLTFLKERFEGVEDVCVPKLSVKIFDQTFIRHLMLGIDGCHAKTVSEEAKDFLKYHPELLDNSERLRKDSNVFTYGAKKYITNLKNALIMNFEKLMRTYLKSLEKLKQIDDSERIYILYKIMGWSKMPKDCETKTPRQLVLDIIQGQRRILGLKDGEKINDSWFKSEENLLSLLRHRVFLNRLPETQIKRFNLVPISNLKMNFITIDNDVLEGILKEINVLRKDSKDPDMDNLWRSVFKVEKFETESKKFSAIVETDGVSLCIHYKRPKVVIDKEQILEKQKDLKTRFQDSSNIRRLACDPGRKNIYTIVELAKNAEKKNKQIKDYKEYSLTREQYYTLSGINKANKKIKLWSQTIQEELSSLSKVTTKGVSLEDHYNYLETFKGTFEKLWTEYSAKKYSEQRLRLYGAKKRVLDNFWNGILGKDRNRDQTTILAYGNAKFAPGGKGEVNVPNSAALKACSRQKNLQVLFVDEFRTSKVCHHTEQLLKLVKVQGEQKALRGLLWCSSTIDKESKQGAFVNRDVNAALNIYKIAKEVSRPKILDPSKAKKRLPKQQIGKILKNNRMKPESVCKIADFDSGRTSF